MRNKPTMSKRHCVVCRVRLQCSSVAFEVGVQEKWGWILPLQLFRLLFSVFNQPKNFFIRRCVDRRRLYKDRTSWWCNKKARPSYLVSADVVYTADEGFGRRQLHRLGPQKDEANGLRHREMWSSHGEKTEHNKATTGENRNTLVHWKFELEVIFCVHLLICCLCVSRDNRKQVYGTSP